MLFKFISFKILVTTYILVYKKNVRKTNPLFTLFQNQDLIKTDVSMVCSCIIFQNLVKHIGIKHPRCYEFL